MKLICNKFVFAIDEKVELGNICPMHSYWREYIGTETLTQLTAYTMLTGNSRALCVFYFGAK